MVRRNGKQQVISYENSIKKSNELSMAKLSHGLTLNQMQLLAFAIYCTQQDGETTFIKADFEKKFGLEKYKTEDAYKDSDKISALRFSTSNLEEKKFRFTPVFSDLQYLNGTFKFEWNPKMIPHILELKEKYVSTDLTITSKFRSSFSWTLYDYLKAHYGFWHKVISKDSLMKLFGVEDRKSYKNSTAQFKRGVLDVAIAEINQHTELEVRYEEIKEGRAIVGFDLIWSTGTNQKSATKKQIKELKVTVDAIVQDALIFVDLNDEKDRQQAIKIVQETKEMLPFTAEPICITYEKADELIQKANDNLRELNNMLKKTGRDTSFYYNWLEEEGN